MKKNKIIIKFIEALIYVSSYMSCRLTIFIGNRCKNSKIKKFFLSAHALNRFRYCLKELSNNDVTFLLF